MKIHMQNDNYHKLSEQEIQNELNRLQGWTIVNGKLTFEALNLIIL